MNASRKIDLAIEVAASALTLAGIYAGSTTTVGACFYLTSLIFWFWITYRKSLWGLMPLNVATLALSLYNLFRAVG